VVIRLKNVITPPRAHASRASEGEGGEGCKSVLCDERLLPAGMDRQYSMHHDRKGIANFAH
jgi:hypothetical protein